MSDTRKQSERTQRIKIPEYKIDRIIELGRKGNVTVAQIAERLDVGEHIVRKTCKAAGVTPKSDKPFAWGKWLQAQYAKDKAAGRKTGKRPPPFITKRIV